MSFDRQAWRSEHANSLPHRASVFPRKFQKHVSAKYTQVTTAYPPADYNFEDDTSLFEGILTTSSSCTGTVPNFCLANTARTRLYTQQQLEQEAELFSNMQKH